MQRTRPSKKVDAILCDDFHLREDTPVCYVGDFWNDQWEAVDFVSELQRKYGCPVLHAGDLFHTWKPSPYLLSVTIENLPNNFHTIYGQHDLPQHNLELAYKSGVDTLLKAKKLEVLSGVHWGHLPDKDLEDVQVYKSIPNNRGVLVWHTMTYTDQEPYPNCPDPPAIKLLKKYSEYDLICTGDNHQTFTEQHQGRLLVNAGSLTRQTAAQMDHRPCVFLWHAENNTVTRVELPFKEGVISREHLERKEERDGRIEAFISKLDGEWKAEMSFEDNLEAFFAANDIRESVKNIIYKSLEK
jgi:predicted phosphodiesterase